MKTVIERLGAVQEGAHDKFQAGISLVMILFFLIIGVASLIVLINSPA